MEHVTQKHFESFLAKRTEPEWFTQLRTKAFETIAKKPFPNFRLGLSIIVKPKEYDFSTVAPNPNPKVELIMQQDSCCNVDIFTGDKTFSPEAADLLKPFFEKGWTQPEDEQQIYYFNRAFTNDVVLIRIPKGAQLTKPIELNYAIADSSVLSTILVLAEENTHAKIVLNKDIKSMPGAYLGDDIRIIAHKNSHVDFVTIQNTDHTAVNFQKRTSLGKKDSRVNWTDLCLGTHYTRTSVISNLNEEGAESEQTVLFLGTDEQRYDLFTGSIHRAPRTYSNLVTKGVLTNDAQSLARGLVRIEKNADDSNGYEKQDTLLLSPTAQANANPDLEIHNPNVKCSHGSTVGRIDEEKLFYLMSRGLSRKEAEQKIAEGYFTPVLELFSDEALRERIHTTITQSLERIA